MSKAIAARTFRRIMRPKLIAQAEAAWADAQFDGGEWSTSAHDRLFEDLEQNVAALVARKFSITVGDLFDALNEFNYKEWEHEVEARHAV